MRIILEPTQTYEDRDFEAQNPRVSVEVQSDDLSVSEALELFKAALRAWGFVDESADSLVVEVNGIAR